MGSKNKKIKNKIFIDKTTKTKRIIISNNIKDVVYAKNNGKCFYCGKELSKEEATIEHLIPKNSGGTDDIKNLFIACEKCNREKGHDFLYKHLTAIENFMQKQNEVINNKKDITTKLLNLMYEEIYHNKEKANKIKHCERENTNLKNEVNNKKAEIEKLKKEKNKLLSTIAQLKNDNKETDLLRVEIKNIKEENKKIQSKCRTLEEINRKEKSDIEYKEIINKLENKIKLLENDREQKQKKYDEYDKKIIKKDKIINRLEKEIGDIKNKESAEKKNKANKEIAKKIQEKKAKTTEFFNKFSKKY